MHENDIVNEPTTSPIKIPNFLLDDWANAYQFDPISEALEIGLGTFCISKKDALVPNLMKIKEETSGICGMYFDRSRNKNGSRVGVMLVLLHQKGTTSHLGFNSVVPIMWRSMRH